MNRRLFFIIGLVLLFGVVVTVWYFFYAKPATTPTLGAPTNSFLSGVLPKGFNFILGNSGSNDSTSTTEFTPKGKQVFAKVWDKPMTGQAFVTKEVLKEIEVPAKTGTTTVKQLVRVTINMLMFVDRATGYIYGYDTETGEVFQISNSTIPGIYDAYIFSNGSRVVMRYEDRDKKTITSILASIPPVITGQQPQPLIDISYLPNGIPSIAVGKSGGLSYVVPNNTGSSIYTVSSKGSSLSANSPFKEWLVNYGGDNLYVTAKPSAYIEGSTYALPSFSLTLGGKTGLMSNPGEGGVMINSMWTSRGLATFMSSGGSLSSLSISTIASKCEWGQKSFLVCGVPKSLGATSEGLPDDWFQGRVMFDDSLYAVDAPSATSYLLYSFDSSLGKFDITHIAISSDNNFLALSRKQDGSLWVLNRSLISQ